MTEKTLQVENKMSSSGKELLPDLQQLLKYLEPTFRDVAYPGSNTSIEDVLRNLEETDENFHRYILFVRIIRIYLSLLSIADLIFVLTLR